MAPIVECIYSRGTSNLTRVLLRLTAASKAEISSEVSVPILKRSVALIIGSIRLSASSWRKLAL